jgi:DNA (cytosine-5)-methyltransferase 1
MKRLLLPNWKKYQKPEAIFKSLSTLLARLSAIDMRYLSVCSGIEGATVAWAPLGWKALAFAETHPFCRALLKHRYPGVPNLGDFTAIDQDSLPEKPDLIVGGTPCQAFSIAGLRKGLDDPRGNLTLEYINLVGRLRPRWFLWENVPGVFDIDRGRTFGAILGRFQNLGYSLAYRELDLQYFGCPQVRKRVFVVGHSGDWRHPANVLFEPGCLYRHPKEDKKAQKRIAATLAARSLDGGQGGTRRAVAPIPVNLEIGSKRNKAGKRPGIGLREPGDPAYAISAKHCHGVIVPDVARTLTKYNRLDAGTETFIVEDKAKTITSAIGRQDADSATLVMAKTTDTVTASWDKGSSDGQLKFGQLVPAMTPNGIGVRRLMPIECERLQGFEDNWTLVPYRGGLAADSPRYKALGNAFPVPVVRWIGERIEAEDKRILKEGI